MRTRFYFLLALLLLALVLAGCEFQQTTPVPTAPSVTSPSPAGATPTPDPGVLAAPVDRAALLAAVPALADREARFAAALAGDQPILTLDSGLDDRQQQAQALAVADPQVQFFARDVQTQQPVRSEIMLVRPALPSDFTQATAVLCPGSDCYRVEMFNYSANATVVMLVNLRQQQVVDITFNPDVQPELPPYLADLAVQIAIHSPEVADALGFKPGAGLAGMPGVKTALNNSQCERSHHLCVGPTFRVDDRFLWAIVDLTEGRLVGTRWTPVGNGNDYPVTEQSLQDAVVMADYCEKVLSLEQQGWQMEYTLTSSDGLEVKNVRYNDKPVLASAKIVDWHVSYSGTDGFGYSDATGCPLFSTASVVAFNGPAVQPIRQGDAVIGFALEQDFRSELWPAACNYRYVQRYEFYNDGSFRVGGMNMGRGCSNRGIYRPVVRIDLASGADGVDSEVQRWDGTAWQPWNEEGWVLQDAEAPHTADGYDLRISGAQGRGYYLAVNRGQLAGGERGDTPYFFLTLHKPEEGDADMITIGSCCNNDYQQGPEKFLTPAESVAGQNSVLWYVPQIKNDDTPGAQYCWTESTLQDGLPQITTYPCAFGPLFVPVAVSDQ
ncbi:MAG: hypothetical protein ABTQ73_11090 [Caldilineales bacterium]